MASGVSLVQLNILFYAVAALLLVLSAAITVVQVRRSWHATKTNTKPVEPGALPSDLPPAAAGLLLRIGRTDEADLLAATLLDLALRGYLTVVHAPGLVAAGLADNDSAFMLVRCSEAAEPSADFLRPYEASLLDTLFRAAYLDAVPLELALRTYREARENGDGITDGARAVLLQRALIDTKRRTTHLIALGLLVPLAVACISVTAALFVSSIFVDWSGLATLSACAALELLIVSVLIAYDLRLRTPAGRTEALRWQDYARSLKDGADVRAGAYALAFGMGAAMLAGKLDAPPSWLLSGEIDTIARADLPQPEAVADAAGHIIARIRPDPALLPDLAAARATLTTFVNTLQRRKGIVNERTR